MTDLEFKRQKYLIDDVSYIIDSLKDNNQYDADDGAAALGVSRSGFMRQAVDRVVKRTARNARPTELAA